MSVWNYLVRPLLNVTGRGKLNIFVYHRVLEQPDELFPETPDARRFDDQMRWVAGSLNVLPLTEAIGLLRENRLPSRAACITFDDGYADNATVALPILRRHRLSATFFIATGYLDGGRMFNDTIIEGIRRARSDSIDLTSIDLGSYRVDTPTQKRKAIEELIAKVKYLPGSTRQDSAAALERAITEPLPQDLMMTSLQVRELYDAGMGIGAHTVSHPILSTLDHSRSVFEIRESRSVLESITGSRIELFAYPNGKRGQDYVQEHVDIVRSLGFSAALSTHWGVANAATDLFQLPRFTPWGTTPITFNAGLARNQLGRL